MRIRKHLDISLNEDEKILNYKYYYFSGFPIPKDIKAWKKQNTPTIDWDLGNLTIENFEKKNNIKYQIKITEEVGKSPYYSSSCTLESNHQSITIRMAKKTFIVYNVKIRAFIDNVFGEWSESERFDRY